MAANYNIALVRRLVDEVWNDGDLESLGDYHPAVFENHGTQTSIDEAKGWYLRLRGTFPDIFYTIDDIWATDERVALRWTATATHTGNLWGLVPPTGKTITWIGIHMFRIEDGRIVEVWALQDAIEQLQQMGVTLKSA